MMTKVWITLIASHLIAGVAGFAGGVYLLPILVAPPAPSEQEIQRQLSKNSYTGQFRRELKDSDLFHWGEGTVSVGPGAIILVGAIAPGPDYKLYLSPKFVETKKDFLRLKSEMVRVGDVRTFNNFLVEVPAGVDTTKYNSVIVWCESFNQFITAAQYRH